MSRRRASARRSATDRAVRGLAAAVALGMGYVSVARTMAYALRTDNTEHARLLGPHDGRITALIAYRMAGVEATAADRARADRLAREALRQDATAVAAASTLGINAQVRGDTPSARRLFAYAERLSRRDLQTQLWAVEDAVGRADISGALKHYDIALRTSHRAPDLLFPVLGSAISEPTVRASLIATLAAKPNWAAAFVHYVAGDGPDPRATASLLLGLRRVGFPVSEEARAAVIKALVSRDLIQPAWSYYAAIHSNVDRRRSRDPNFSAELAYPTLFDWVPSHEAGITASIQRGDRGGIFDFAVAASVGGVLVQQMQSLPAGDYRLEGHSIGIDQPENARPYWVLSCHGGRELGRIAVPNSAEANGFFTGRFSVPTGCAAQMLGLVSQPSDTASGLSGQIDYVRLSPDARSRSVRA